MALNWLRYRSKEHFAGASHLDSGADRPDMPPEPSPPAAVAAIPDDPPKSCRKALAQDLHGRPPELIAPAQCRSADLRDGQSLTGLGVLALTDQAVLYSTGERVVVLQRDGLRAGGRGTRLELESSTPQGRMVLSMPDPTPWRERLST